MRTYSDIIQHVQRVLEGTAGRSASQAQIRTAIQTAYEKLPVMHSWNWFSQPMRLWINAPQSTGTVTYDADNRRMTLSDSTWPSWAEGCTIRINEVSYPVSRRISDTVVEINARNIPNETIEDSSYTIYHDYHALPADFLLVASRMYVDRYYEMSYVSASSLQDHAEESGVPSVFAIVPGVNNDQALRVRPYPGSNYRMECSYVRRPRAMRHSGLDQRDFAGTVSISGENVSGNGTQFANIMEGAVLRIGNTSRPPTSLEDPLNPYAEECLIESVTDATHLVLRSSASSSYNDVYYTITDRVDATEPLYQLLVALALDELSEILRANIPSRSQEAFSRAADAEAGSRELGSVGGMDTMPRGARWWKGNTPSVM